jgi:hypothetical protein
VLLGEQMASKPIARRSNRRPSASSEASPKGMAVVC